MENELKIDKQLIKAFKEGNVQLFIGSGLSSPPYLTANQFKDKLLDDPSFDYQEKGTLRDILNDGDISLEDAAEFFEIYRGSDDIVSKIKEMFKPREYHTPRQIHKKIWMLPNIKLVYTTNFDCLIENAIERPKKQPRVVTKVSALKHIEVGERIVFKPHGCAVNSNKRSDFVISRKDYLNYSYYKPLEELKTKYDISQKTFLFLGYSLRDINMRQIIFEANRMNLEIKVYAVMNDVLGPEARYWKNQKVTLIAMDAEKFIDKLLKCFILDESEWGEKSVERIKEKKQISQKAVDEIATKASDKPIVIFLDSGSTCLNVAEILIDRISSGEISGNNITVITNSAPIITLISQTNLSPNQCFDFIILGGKFKYSTRAIVNNSDWAILPNEGVLHNNTNRIISFIGVTALDNQGLKTKTIDEIDMKQFFIKESDEVFVLADHSKNIQLREGKVFSTFLKDKMILLTDRVEVMKAEFGNLVKEVK